MKNMHTKTKMETERYLQLCRALKDKIRNKIEEISVIH